MILIQIFLINIRKHFQHACVFFYSLRYSGPDLFPQSALYKSLGLCVQMIGWLFLASSVLFPRLPGYHSSGIEIFSYGSFVLIDGINLTLGILIIIFGCLIHEGLRMQKDLDEVL